MRTLTLGLLALAIATASLRAQDNAADIVYLPGQVDQMPRRVSGPSLDYPPNVLKMGDGERVLIEAVFDTTGHIEPASLRILQTVDSAMNPSVRATLLATVYAPAMVKGHPVRFMGQVWLVLHARGSTVNATSLISGARALPSSAADSALRLLALALDSSAHPTDGERTYALLVRGVVETHAGRSETGKLDEKRGLDLWRLEHARGVELAPFLNDLADSVRLAGQGARAMAVGDLVVLGTADVAPALLSQPPVIYPPEARALGVVGTVTVEAEVDSTGRVSGTPTVVESPNPLLNAAAVRIVRASRYRPARLGKRLVGIRIRQAITFRP
jgi:TonB family protein